MTNAIRKTPVVSAAGVICIICGLALILSVFLPWLVASPAIAADFESNGVSAFNISGILGLAGIGGGLLCIGFTFIPAKGARKILTVLLGVVVLGVLGLFLANGTFPLISSMRLGFAQIGVGCVIYAISGVVLVFTGLAIRTVKSPAASPKEAPVMYQGNVSPAYIPPRPAPVMAQNSGNTCQACGAAVSVGAAYCRQCGAALNNSATFSGAKPGVHAYCASCGTANPGGGSFCTKCGMSMTEAPAAPPKPAPPVYCTRCGTAASSGAVYCGRCGSPLSH